MKLTNNMVTTDDYILRNFMNTDYKKDDYKGQLEFIMAVPNLLRNRLDNTDHIYWTDIRPLPVSTQKITRENILQEITIIAVNVLAECFNDCHNNTYRDTNEKLANAKKAIITDIKKRMTASKETDHLIETLCAQLNDMMTYFVSNDIGNPFGVRYDQEGNLCQDDSAYFMRKIYSHHNTLIHKDTDSVHVLMGTYFDILFERDYERLIMGYIHDIFVYLGCAIYHDISFPSKTSILISTLAGYPAQADPTKMDVCWNDMSNSFYNLYFTLVPVAYNYLLHEKDEDGGKEFFENLHNKILAMRKHSIDRYLRCIGSQNYDPTCAIESMRSNELKEAMESVFEEVSEADIQHRELDMMSNEFKNKVSNLK